MTATGGIVLAGGGSRRMGAPKAGLEWHGSTLLRRVVGLVARGVRGPVVVVRAVGQELPALPAWVRVVEDPVPDQGPLAGVVAGLRALEGEAGVAFVAATDAPFLAPAFIARVLEAVAPGDVAAVPVVDGRRHPLTAAYRLSFTPALADLLAAGRLRMEAAVDGWPVAWLDAPALAAVDPGLDSLRNLNTPEDYRAARALPAPAVTVQGRTVPVATLGVALLAAGVGLHTRAVLNGAEVEVDRELPLVRGDVVTFV